MNAAPSSSPAVRPVEGCEWGGDEASDTTCQRWAALAEAATIVTRLAGLEPEWTTPEARDFPALIRNADPWRRERAEIGIADLAAVMEPGMTALLAISARGALARPAALALLHEFNAGRAALLALLPPSDWN